MLLSSETETDARDPGDRGVGPNTRRFES
jgi:hypothetical protein